MSSEISAHQNTIHGSSIAPAPPEGAPTSPGRIRPILIRQLDHGYNVEVGCQTVAIESTIKLISLLSAYIHQPASTEQLYFEHKLL